MAVRMVVVVLTCFIAIGCADASSALQPSSAAAEGEGDPVPNGVILATPTTVEVALADDTRQRLERHLGRGSLAVVRMAVNNLRPRSADGLKGVRIFIEKPDAGPRTPSDDPHFAGAFVLGLQSPENMLLNVAPALSRVHAAEDLRGRKALRVTFVPESVDPTASLPKDFALTFDSVTFEVPDEQ